MSRVRVKKLVFKADPHNPFHLTATGLGGELYHVERPYSQRKPGYGLITVPHDVAEQEKKDALTKGIYDVYVSRLCIPDEDKPPRYMHTTIGQYIGMEAAMGACQYHFDTEVRGYLEEDE